MENGEERKPESVKLSDTTSISRREFIQALSVAPLAAMGADTAQVPKPMAYFTNINHWHQAGVGWFFRRGVVAGKQYHRAFSVFYGVQKTIDAVERWPWLTICLEFDSHAYEAMDAEDADFVKTKFRSHVESGHIDITGGTYSEPYPQLIGWQSNVRQFIDGRRIVRQLFGKEVDCFLAEEIAFHPQLPQVLLLCGFSYASLQSQNDGSAPLIDKALIKWRGLDGSEIPTIPHNRWMIPLTKQYQSLAPDVSSDLISQQGLLTIWAEIWPPGMDWGASYLPYEQGIESLRSKGLKSIGVNKYMRLRCKTNTKPETRYLRMDAVSFTFGWPQNQDSLWANIGGWGYEGDWLQIQNRRLEHELNAVEILSVAAPDAKRSNQLAELWKNLMVTQNHDVFIVSGFPAEYEGVRTTNLEVAGMRFRKVESGVQELRRAFLESPNRANQESRAATLICQNPASVPVQQPVMFEWEGKDSTDYVLRRKEEMIEVQRVPGEYLNSKPKYLALVNLPSCGFQSFSLAEGPSSKRRQPVRPEGSIHNEYYSVKWDLSRKGFLISSLEDDRTVLFRPFSGDIKQVKESDWKAPNSGVTWRATKFDEIDYQNTTEIQGPLYYAIEVRGDILKLSTTPSSAAWVTARAVLYRGMRRVDILATLHTYPRMGFLALAELELESPDPIRVFRDFPFGEEPSQNEQFSALNYVRLQAPNYSALIAHGGTQQFFRSQVKNVTTLRNMVARETLKGIYHWRWSITLGREFSPAESYRFAESSRGPVVDVVEGVHQLNASFVSVNDPAVVVFRLAREMNRMTLWLTNYSDQPRNAVLDFPMAFQSVRRTNMEGNRWKGALPLLGHSGKTISMNLSGWEIAALELQLR